MVHAESTPAEAELLDSLDGDVLTITFNRPQKLNALTEGMFAGLSAILRRVEQMDEVRAVVITGAGRAFSCGVDVDMVRVLHERGRGAGARAIVRRWQAVFEQVEDLEKPVIAALNGVTVGGALELAMACDFRIAAPGIRLGLPETKLGAFPDGGGQRLARLVGLGRAKDLIMTGRLIDAAESERIGLVSRVAPADGFQAAVQELIGELRETSPLGVGLAKRALNRGFGADLRTAMELELFATGSLYPTEDVLEAYTAFKERRKPIFRGR
ncbi:MAG: enoyl-CoA hydratase/isomerase family protein [Chloroflexi bacterium]|nr:enoyl-CoA hydratase/isomerase family protein [Chloroflexota bacterium]